MTTIKFSILTSPLFTDPLLYFECHNLNHLLSWFQPTKGTPFLGRHKDPSEAEGNRLDISNQSIECPSNYIALMITKS